MNKLTEGEKKVLMSLARETIKTKSDPKASNLTPLLEEKRGAFVSLHCGDELRGCIGHLLPVKPLYQAVIENALAAAYNDSRFEPLTQEEFDELEIEISVLTEPVQINYSNSSELLKQLNSEQGIIIKNKMRMATFLPQVWTQIKDKREFLAHLCLKAGLPPDAWKSNDTEIYIYRVDNFSEKL
jgi:AmmeMemoRadiSam system protein A